MTVSFKKSIENNFTQRIATLAVFMLTTQMGIYFGWPSPNIARLLSGKAPIECTPSDISWLVSLTPIGSFLGAILGSILIEYIGTRKIILVINLFIGISWLCVLSANSINWLFAARFIGGFTMTIILSCSSMYLSEISAPEVRGTLISLAMIGVPFGNLLGLTTETYLPPNVPCLIYLLMVLIAMSILMYLHDTPYYLVKNGDVKNAEKSIIFYRGGIKVEEELKEIRIFAENSDSGIRDKLSQLQLPAVKRAIIIIIIVFALPDASGVLTIASYTEVILVTSGFDFIEPKQWVVYSFTLSVIFSCLTVKLLDKLGRRFALSVSSIGTSVALAALGLQFYLLKSGIDVQNFQWLSVSSLFVYSISYNTGYGTVPSTLLSEMFPENIKSIAACLGSLTASLTGFIVVKAYQPLVDSIGAAYVFWIHAMLSFLMGLSCALFLLIETKNKTFQQIQEKLRYK